MFVGSLFMAAAKVREIHTHSEQTFLSILCVCGFHLSFYLGVKMCLLSRRIKNPEIWPITMSFERVI